MNNICILLNGPPGSGKDTLAKMISDQYGYAVKGFKDQLYEDTAKYFNIPVEELKARHADRNLKEIPWDRLHMRKPLEHIKVSTRDALIFISESVYKPVFGEDIYGIAAVNSCTLLNLTNVVFADSGFRDEAERIIDSFRKVFIFQLHRTGCSYVGDSRGYLTDLPQMHTLMLEDGKPEKAVKQIMEIVNYYE